MNTQKSTTTLSQIRVRVLSAATGRVEVDRVAFSRVDLFDVAGWGSVCHKTVSFDLKLVTATSIRPLV